jgi:hypothetical protein
VLIANRKTPPLSRYTPAPIVGRIVEAQTVVNSPSTGQIAGHELVGHRLVGVMPSQPLVNIWLKITSKIVKYGFAIEYRDLEPPRTGIFDGLRLTLDPDVDFEMQCFILLHLFGHSVQWVAPSLAEKLGPLQNTTDREHFMKVLRDYEYEAARFGMQLLHEAGIHDFDQWYADFVVTDWQYLERYYREGAIPPWRECVATGQQLIQSEPIPPLEQKQLEVRFAF